MLLLLLLSFINNDNNNNTTNNNYVAYVAFSPTTDLLNWMSHSTEGRIVFDYIAQTHSPSNRRTSVKVNLSCTESLYMYT